MIKWHAVLTLSAMSLAFASCKTKEDAKSIIVAKAIRHYHAHCLAPRTQTFYLSIEGEDPNESILRSNSNESLKLLPASQIHYIRSRTAQIGLTQLTFETKNKASLKGYILCPGFGWESTISFKHGKAGWEVAHEDGKKIFPSIGAIENLFK
jgi:hypothetical protein